MDLKSKNDIYIGLLGQSYVKGISSRAESDCQVYGEMGVLIGTFHDMIMIPDKCGDPNKYADILKAGSKDDHIVVPFGLIHEDMEGNLVVYELDKSEIDSLPVFNSSGLTTELFSETEKRIFSAFNRKGIWHKLTAAGEYARRRTERSHVISSLNKTLLERTAEISRKSLENVHKSLRDSKSSQESSGNSSTNPNKNAQNAASPINRKNMDKKSKLSQAKSSLAVYHAQDISDLPLLIAPVGINWGVILKGEQKGGMSFDSYEEALQFAREAAIKISADIHVLNDKGEFLEKISVF